MSSSYQRQIQQEKKLNIKKDNKQLVHAWIKLESILQDFSENEQSVYPESSLYNNNQSQTISGGPTKKQINLLKKSSTNNLHRPLSSVPLQNHKSEKQLRPMSGMGFPGQQHKRPISAISKNSSQFNFQGMQNLNQESTIYEMQQSGMQTPISMEKQDKQPLSKVSTMKSLMNLRAQSRPHSRPGTANVHVKQQDLQVLSQIPDDQMETLIQKSEIIHSLQVDQILDLYTGKCLDTKVEYKPEHAVKFIEKIRKQCKKRTFILNEQGLGLESANVLAHIFQNNSYFSKINLEKNCLSDSGVALLGEALKYNNSVIHLNLASNDIYTPGFVSLFESLLENESIVSLDVSSREGLYRNRISIEASEALEQYLRYTNILMFLNISSTNITRESLEAVLIGSKNSNTLIQLDISNNMLGSFITEDLLTHLQCTNIIDLNLSKNKIGDVGINALSEMLGHKSKDYRFQKLNLSDNSITSYGIGKLFTAMTKNSYIQELYLDNNSFLSKSFAAITNLLWETNSIRILSMNNCQIQKEGGEYIGYGISKNKSVEELYLAQNKLRDYGMKIIAEGLKENDVIHTLDLSQCKIGDEGGIALSQALSAPDNKIQKINLFENDIHDYSGVLLAETIRLNKNIVQFNVERNPISYKYAEDIYKSIDMNIADIKKHKVSKFLNVMHDLKAFERQKYDVEINKVQLDLRQETVEQQVKKEEEIFQQQQEKEYRLTQKKQKELEGLQKEFKQILREVEDTDNEIKNYLSGQDFDIKEITRNIGHCRSDIMRIKSEIDKIRTSQVLKHKLDKVKYFEQQFKEVKSKQVTATESYKSTVKQITRLKDSIAKLESGYDSEEEKEKEELKKQQELKELEEQKLKKNQRKSTKKGGKNRPSQQNQVQGAKKSVIKK